MTHIPVLLDAVVENLNIQPGGIYVDATFGCGGHAEAILKKLDHTGHLLAFDKDDAAHAMARSAAFSQDPRFSIVHQDFRNLYEVIAAKGWLGKVNGILLDVGISSPQIDQSERGFSFQRSGPLDMRMDRRQKLQAKQWINTAKLANIIAILRLYGQERYAKRIGQHIVQVRAQRPIETTGQLADIVARAHPRWEKHQHPATRTFQAIRIFINQELESLQLCLMQSAQVLKQKGRLLVITFHSLEARIVKHFLRQYTRADSPLPSAFPTGKKIGKQGVQLKQIGKTIHPTCRELVRNLRARSAHLRVIEKQ